MTGFDCVVVSDLCVPTLCDEHGQQVLFWVCSTLDVIPPGSVIINPDTRESTCRHADDKQCAVLPHTSILRNMCHCVRINNRLHHIHNPYVHVHVVDAGAVCYRLAVLLC